MHVWARVAGVIIALAIMVTFLAMPAFPLVLAPPERLINGSFEAGFTADGAGQGWQPFERGDWRCAWSAERAEPNVWDGSHAQRLSMRRGDDATDIAEASIGIAQSVDLSIGETYQLTLRGALLLDAVATGVAVQWGLDPAGGQTPDAVREWMDIPWEPAVAGAAPVALRPYATTFTAMSVHPTLFVRAYAPPATPIRQLDLLLDGLSLRGSQPAPAAGIAGFRGPTVSITAPIFPVIGSPVFLHVMATHPAGVLSVRLFDNGVEIGRVTRTAPTTALEENFVWLPTTPGSHRLRAEASNLAGEVGMALQLVTVGETMALGAGEAQTGVEGPAWQIFGAGGEVSRDEAGRLRIAGVGRPLAGEECFVGLYRELEGLRAGAAYDLRLAGRLGEPLLGERWQAEYAIAWSDARAALQDLGRLEWQALPWPAGGVGPLPMYVASLTARGERATLLLRARRLLGTSRCAGQWTVESVSLRGYQ